MPGLPQELIDHITDYVHDRKSLKACSLVSSQWSPRSRKRLFAQVEFTSIRDLQRWCARIRPGPLGLSPFVEDLTLSEYHSTTTSPSPSWLHSSILINAAAHFRSFSALRALEVQRWRMSTDRVSSMLNSFGSSLENVTRLTLRNVIVYSSTLAVFVSNFPRLDDLSISAVGFRPSVGRNSAGDLNRGSHAGIAPTHPRGEFSASGVSILFQAPKDIFAGITLLEPRFHRVTLAYVSYNAWRDYWPLVEACAGSLEELRILANATGADCDGLSLACCPNLRRVVLSLDQEQPARPCQFVERCLSTITSTQLSEVSLRLLRGMPDFRPPCPNPAPWDSLDIILCNLAGKYRPRYEGDRMLVKLVDVNLDPSEAENLLRRYRERGTLRVNSATWFESSEG